MENSHKIALGTMFGVIVLMLLIIIALQYNETNKLKIQSAYNNGYLDGYVKGKTDGRQEILNIIEESKKHTEQIFK